MRWRGVGDGCGEQEGRGEMGVADSAGELKEGMVDADGEHIQQPKLGNAMIEVKDLPVYHQSGIRKSKTA
jgi:hypothetical protein